MDILSFNPSIQSSLECPVCFNFLSIPILQCRNGHSFCSECSRNSVICPLCRCEMPQAYRNITLERILENIELHCSFPECHEELTLATRKAHIDECPHNPNVKCVIEGCKWGGDNIVSHLKSVHGVKEFYMNRHSGVRGWNSKSWKEADWGFSIWNFEGDIVLNQSKSNRNFFYLWVYQITQTSLNLKLSVEKNGAQVSFVVRTASIKNQEKGFPFHLSLQEIEKHLLEDATGFEEGYKRLTISVQLL